MERSAKPTYLTVSGVAAVPEPDAPCVPIYTLSVYLERDSGTLEDVIRCLAVRTEPQLGSHRGAVVALLRRALYREEKALMERCGLRPADLCRADILPEYPPDYLPADHWDSIS